MGANTNPPLEDGFCTTGTKEDITESLQLVGVTPENPMINGYVINKIFNMIFENLNHQKKKGFAFWQPDSHYEATENNIDICRRNNKIFFCKQTHNETGEEPKLPENNPDYWTLFYDFGNPPNTGDGNKYIPPNGTTNAGKFLQATGTAGVYTWTAPSAESTSSTPNTIAKRDAGGFINAAGFYSELADTTTASTHFYVQVNNNKYIRPKAIENVKAELLANAALTGVTTAPTASVGDNSTKIATTAFVLANSNKAILGLGAIGCYAFLMLDSNTTIITPGTIYPSSSLKYTGIATELENSSSVKLFVGTGGMAAGNSWMAMGGITVTTGFKYGTLFQRIA